MHCVGRFAVTLFSLFSNGWLRRRWVLFVGLDIYLVYGTNWCITVFMVAMTLHFLGFYHPRMC